HTGGAVRLQPHRVDNRVGTATCGEIAQLFDNRVGQIVGEDAVTLRHLAPLPYRIHREHPKTVVHADPRDELPDGAEPEHSECAAFRNIGILDSLPGSRQDIAEVKVAIIWQTASHPNVVV